MSNRSDERLTVTLRLRPIRIAFLIDEYDPEQARQAVQINTCLWGGMFNPIIPVHRAEGDATRIIPRAASPGFPVIRGSRPQYRRFSPAGAADCSRPGTAGVPPATARAVPVPGWPDGGRERRGSPAARRAKAVESG